MAMLHHGVRVKHPWWRQCNEVIMSLNLVDAQWQKSWTFSISFYGLPPQGTELMKSQQEARTEKIRNSGALVPWGLWKENIYFFLGFLNLVSVFGARSLLDSAQLGSVGALLKANRTPHLFKSMQNTPPFQKQCQKVWCVRQTEPCLAFANRASKLLRRTSQWDKETKQW